MENTLVMIILRIIMIIILHCIYIGLDKVINKKSQKHLQAYEQAGRGTGKPFKKVKLYGIVILKTAAEME